jgi:hypothetical protein
MVSGIYDFFKNSIAENCLMNFLPSTAQAFPDPIHSYRFVNNDPDSGDSRHNGSAEICHLYHDPASSLDHKAGCRFPDTSANKSIY